MHDIEELVSGYQRFYANRDSEETYLFRRLADQGQAPKTMIISCCDSRVDPSAIFDAGPGDLFVVRNVANLVPPYEPDGDYHGTSAALEFAVTGLNIENIIVMGHAHCGGVKAFLDGTYGQTDKSGFIGKWISLLNPALSSVIKSEQIENEENDKQKMLEMDSIRCSLRNLRSFPFIDEALSRQALRLRGAYFSIFHGSLLGMNEKTGEFNSINID